MSGPTTIQAVDEGHHAFSPLETRCLQDLKQLALRGEFVRPFTHPEWQGLGFRDIGPLVAIVSMGPFDGMVEIDIRRRPSGFASMSSDERLAAAKRSEHISHRVMGVPAEKCPEALMQMMFACAELTQERT